MDSGEVFLFSFVICYFSETAFYFLKSSTLLLFFSLLPKILYFDL